MYLTSLRNQKMATKTVLKTSFRSLCVLGSRILASDLGCYSQGPRCVATVSATRFENTYSGHRAYPVSSLNG